MSEPSTTLRGLERDGLSLQIVCRTCRRWAVKGPQWYDVWIKDYGRGADDIPLRALIPSLKCACGAKNARVTVVERVDR
ncbi:MAG TPA: hypothetical protein VJR58_15135 [Vineibacter sp.]|nr:hypothetical protein [Vineibacter sp.]